MDEWDLPQWKKEVESLKYQLAYKREMSSKTIPESRTHPQCPPDGIFPFRIPKPQGQSPPPVAPGPGGTLAPPGRRSPSSRAQNNLNYGRLRSFPALSQSWGSQWIRIPPAEQD